MERQIPDFLVIGAAKSGTTSLISDLKNHPEIHTPGFEINYFSHFYSNGPEWYHSLFNCPEKIQGEKSTSYLYETECHKRIFSHNPSIKLIVLLREPVKRAFSNWAMRYTQGRLLKQTHLFNKHNLNIIENIGFSHLFNAYLNTESDVVRHQEPLDIFERGLYIEQLTHLRRFFSAGQILILISERYFKNPEPELKKLSSFLNVSDFPSAPPAWKRKSEYYAKPNEATIHSIRQFYKPYNEKLFRFLGFEIDEWSQL